MGESPAGVKERIAAVQTEKSAQSELAAAPVVTPVELVRLKQGDTVGTRFVIDERLRDDVLGGVYRAVDEKSGKKIVIVMLDGTLAGDRGATEELRSHIKVATGLAHKNLVSVFGLGKEGRRRYIAREYVDGQTLSELLQKKAEAGKNFTLKGAYNLIAHVCNALQFMLPNMPHGTLRPGAVLINRTGRVKVADFGVGAIRSALVDRREALSRWDSPCFPESAEGQRPLDARAPDEANEQDNSLSSDLDEGAGREAGRAVPSSVSTADDVYALGAILYALLIGRPLELPKGERTLPPELARRLPVGTDELVARCLMLDDPRRIRDPNSLKIELLRVIEAARGVDAEGEEQDGADGGHLIASETPAMSPIVAMAGRPQPPQSPGVAAQRKKAGPPQRRKEEGSGFIIPELKVAAAVEDDGTSQRWLVEKGGVDFGPFNSKQVIEKLFAEEVSSASNLYDIETDKRLPLAEHSVFDEALVSWIHEKSEREKRRAEEAREASERRRTRMFLTLTATIAIVCGGVGGGYAWYQSSLPEPEKAMLGALVVEWQTPLPQVLLPDEAPETPAEVEDRQRAKSSSTASNRARDEARRAANEERLASASELDASAGTTGRSFDANAMNAAVANRNPQIVRCLQEEIRRDPARRSFEVKATILPRGDIINVRMEGATGAGSSCIRSALAGLKVPAFDGTNQALSLPFNIDR